MTLGDIEYCYVSDYEYDFPINIISNRKATKYYNANFMTFDIETSAIPAIKQSFMYIWQAYDGNKVILGRTWDSFREWIDRISLMVKAKHPMAMQVIYIHFLSHEFQYLSGIYDFTQDEVFATDKRKVLRAYMHGNIELRCSWFLSNMSLGQYTKKMKVKHPKLKGDLDYKKMRYSDTEMDETELGYCVNDVVGLHECITEEMRIMKDNIMTIPLTSTGYVRRDVRNVTYKYRKTLIKKIFPTFDVYKLLRQAFRGGDVHANRYYVGKILVNVHSMDRSSSYPDVDVNDKFPMTQFKMVEEPTKDKLDKYIKSGKACLFSVVLANVRLKDELEGAPYLAYDKCRGVLGKALDNGRILSADVLETTVTDIDWDIITDMYEWDNIAINELYICEYGELPEEIKEVFRKYFRNKTELKGDAAQETFYNKSKNLLNAGYGMMAQCPVKQDILYTDNNFEEDDADEAELLSDYKENAFLVYQWGVWTTAHARHKLHEGRKMVGYNFVYCDTDSVKYVGEIDQKALDRFNTESMERSERNGAYATNSRSGKTYYMGTFEDEGTYRRFRTWGCKRYAYEDSDGELHITTAGVSKEAGAKYLKKKGGIEAYEFGFVFKDCGRAAFTYNDTDYGCYEIDGRKIYITKNMYSEDTEYMMKYQPKYEELVKKSQALLRHENYITH